MNLQGEYFKLSELKTRNEFKLQPQGDVGLIDGEALEELESNGLKED